VARPEDGERPAARRALGALAGAGLLCLALGTWLSFPHAAGRAPARAALRACLLDASASATRRAAGWERWARRALRAEALEARRRGEELALVVFGADVVRLFAPGSPGAFLARLDGAGEALDLRLEEGGERGSELARALEQIAPELVARERAPGTLRLLSQRTFTGRDPAAALARIAAEGASVEWLDPPAPTLADLALVALELPDAPQVGAPLAARVELVLEPGATPLDELSAPGVLTLELEVDSPAGRERRTLALAPPRGAAAPDGALRWTQRVDLGATADGTTFVRAHAGLRGPGALRDGDPNPENDARSAHCRAGQARLAAAIAAPSARPALARWLLGPGRFPGLQWAVIEPAALPALAGELDLFVTLDLPHTELPAGFVQAFVRAGGGWLSAGGWGLLPGWAARPEEKDDPPADLLPLRPIRPEGSERLVQFVVDGSGSMAGEPFERVRRALSELCASALASDRMELCFFTEALHPPLALTADSPAGRRRALQELLAARLPGGSTAVLYSLEQLAAARAGAALPGVAILLSDGIDERAFDVPARAAALHASLAASDTRLAVIAVGAEADLAFLRALVPPDGKLLLAGELGDLEQVFQREINLERVREGELAIVAADPDGLDLAPAAALLRAQLARPAAEWPPAQRALRCEARPGAAVLWRTPQGEPLLALQRVGAGLVATLASAPLAGWAPDWAGADDLLGPLLRTLARGPRGTSLRATLAGGRLVLAGVDPSWPARLRAHASGAAGADGAGGPLEEPLGEVDLLPPALGAGRDPRAHREGPAPAGLERHAGGIVRLSLSDPVGGTALGEVALAPAPPAEFAPDLRRLSAAAAAAPRGAPARAEGSTGRGGHPAAPGVLLAGLVLLTCAALGGLWREAASGFAPSRSKRG